MATCAHCNGSGNVLNEAWDKRYDFLEQTIPAPEYIEAKLEKEGIPKFVDCPQCRGSGTIGE